MGIIEENLMICRNLTMKFGGLVALDDISFSVKTGEIFGIIGPNGAGKSTLFNIIFGFLKPTSGSTIFNNEEISGLRPDIRFMKGLSMTFQLPQYFPELDVLNNVVIGSLKRSYVSKKDSFNSAREVIELLGMSDKSNFLAKDLNVADLKKLEIAKAVVSKPKCLMLDEVMSGLTSRELEDMLEIIKKINKNDITILLIEHIIKAVTQLSQRIMVLDYGKLITIGEPQDVTRNEAVIKCYLG
jgi:branched-chain amino acid transport system ATP-binding protein